MKYRLYDYSELILLTVAHSFIHLGAIVLLGGTIFIFSQTGFSISMIFIVILALSTLGYSIFVLCKEWKYYSSMVLVDNSGVRLTNKKTELFGGSWPEFTRIYFLAQVIFGREVVAMYFLKEPVNIEPEMLEKKWRMSDKFLRTRIEAAKIGEVLKYCPEKKIIWVLDKDCPPERFRKYGIYSYQYKL